MTAPQPPMDPQAEMCSRVGIYLSKELLSRMPEYSSRFSTPGPHPRSFLRCDIEIEWSEGGTPQARIGISGPANEIEVPLMFDPTGLLMMAPPPDQVAPQSPPPPPPPQPSPQPQPGWNGGAPPQPQPQPAPQAQPGQGPNGPPPVWDAELQRWVLQEVPPPPPPVVPPGVAPGERYAVPGGSRRAPGRIHRTRMMADEA